MQLFALSKQPPGLGRGPIIEWPEPAIQWHIGIAVVTAEIAMVQLVEKGRNRRPIIADDQFLVTGVRGRGCKSQPVGQE